MKPGVSLTVSMWAMTGLSIGLVVLRLYTRVRIVHFVGTEDHLFAWTGVLLLGFAASLQVAIHYGLGESIWRDLSPVGMANVSSCIFWTFVANTFAIAANALAKFSMGFFLLRVVQLRGQKVALWLLICVTAGTSVTLMVMLWNQTTPRNMSWDPIRVTHGTWDIQIQPMSVGLGAWSSACDFFFAIFPWMFIWSLRMPRREKIMLASGMSLGVIAGACGIVRTVVLARLDVLDYTKNFATYFIWAGAEIAVAMVCLGIPTLRPLYLRQRGRTIGTGDVELTGQHNHDHDPELPRFTMCEQRASDQKLDPTIQKHPLKEATPSPPGSSQQHEHVDRSPPAYIRDSASSHTMVESPSPELIPLPLPHPPQHHQDPTKPPSIHMRNRSDSDSVDDILGLYDGRDRSRSRNKNRHGPLQVMSVGMAITTRSSSESESRPSKDGVRTWDMKIKDDKMTMGGKVEVEALAADPTGPRSETPSGVILVKSEVTVGVEMNDENWPLRS